MRKLHFWIISSEIFTTGLDILSLFKSLFAVFYLSAPISILSTRSCFGKLISYQLDNLENVISCQLENENVQANPISIDIGLTVAKSCLAN